MSADVYEAMRDRIVRLEYPPGCILNESELSETFGVSRSPIREALKRLELDSLLTILPRKGAQVKQIDAQFILQVIDVRRQLDGYAIRLAAKNATDKDLARLEEIITFLKSEVHLPADQSHFNAVVDADYAFHNIIAEMTGNEYLSKILENIYLHMQRTFHYVHRRSSDFYNYIGNHVQIYENIKSGNAEVAERYAIDHVNEYIDMIKSVWFNPVNRN